MYAGKIMESGVTESVWQQPRHPYTKALLGAIPVPDGAGRLPYAPDDAERATWALAEPLED
jgi:peptide/nickel transport system ATP-binding protein